MAEPIEFCGSNTVFTPHPADEGKVKPMHGYTNGREVISCWKLSPEEAAEVASTGEVWVSIASGPNPPPIKLSGVALMQLLGEDGQPTPGYRSNGAHDEPDDA